MSSISKPLKWDFVSNIVFTETLIVFHATYFIRVRDSALRAVALSCRKLHSVYRPKLLSDVTIDNMNLLKLYLALVRDRQSGTLVRSVTFTHRDASLRTQEEMEDFQKDLSEIYEALKAHGSRHEETIALECLVDGIYRFLPNIQTLLIHQPGFNFPLQSKFANERLAPLPFLIHLLKRLFIPM